MSIKIKAEKVVKRGVQGFIIKEVSALKKDELPLSYLNGEKYCYKYEDGDGIYMNDGYAHYLRLGRFYTVEEMEVILTLLTECGENLRAINAHIKAIKAYWHGEITYKV